MLPAPAPDEVQGVNTRVQLAAAGRLMQARINEAHMLAGVTIVDPATTYLEPGVRIGQDTVIYPNTHLRGETEIGTPARSVRTARSPPARSATVRA